MSNLRDRPGEKTPREQIQEFLSPVRYRRRWSYRFRRGRDYCTGGIPLEELEASAVHDPDTGKPGLLHRKCFNMVWAEIDGRRVQVADRHQKVPICAECKASLSGKNPQLPKKSLANDLWMGKLPAFLKNLSEGAWLLLARLRPFIHRY